MRPTLPVTNRIKGFTMVEALIVASTVSVLMAGLFYALNAGQSSWSFNAAQAEVQSEVRRAADWINNDVRQTRRVDIGSGTNYPSSSHIKFKKVIGYDTAGVGQAILSSNVYEYTYDSDLKTITRTDSDKPGQSWIFHYIIEAPFYTNNGGSIIVIDSLSPNPNSPVYQTGNLLIKLSGQKEVHSGLNAVYALTEEVNIRN